MADVTTNDSSSDHKTEDVVSQAPLEVDSQRDTAPTSEDEQIAQLEYTFPVTILIPSPTNQSTYLPATPADSESSPTKIVIHTASMEVLQDLRMQVQESPFGYWLGPFSFRLPVTEGANKGDVVNKGREALEVRLGEKLSDFIEVGEVFGGEGREGADKVLEVVREPFSETDARTQALRLREYLATGSDAQDPAALGVSPGASMYEAVRDGLVPAVEDKKPSNDVALSNGQKGSSKASKKSAKPAPSQKSTPSVAATKLVASDKHLFNDFEGWVQTPLSTFHPRPVENLNAASCVKSYGVSPWNPPPPQYRAKGHLLYLSVTTLEGESVQLTCTVRGWFVSRSTSVVFDPTPRPSPKDFAAHSLLDLLHGLSPIFSTAFSKLVGKAQDAPAADDRRPRELLAITPIQQALAANPWLVEPAVTTTADPVRQQVSFLLSGATGPDGMEGAKDWNDEIQQAREMARETMQDRVNREKNLARIQAEFTAACVKGVMSISRGDVIPLNPHEVAPAHMWLHRNIFFTKGLDSIDSFSHLGADEAAHVACGKDVAGIRALNQIDVNGACLLGHTVVDWAGERWVCQSFLPGIFRRKDEEIAAAAGEAKVEEVDEAVEKKVADAIGSSSDDKPATAESSAPHLIVYGSDFEAGPEVVRWDPSFHSLMEKVADGFRLAAHDVKSGPNGSKVSLWTSSEVKGLNGTDGRKYILDAYRLSPVDVEFLQKDLDGPIYTKANVEALTKVAGADKAETEETATDKDADAAEETTGGAYPHRLLLLRPELLDSFWDSEFRKWATDLASKRKVKDTPASDEAAADKKDETAEKSDSAEDAENKEKAVPEEEQEQVVVQANGDIHVHKPSGEVTVTKAEGPSARFNLRFNPDAFVDTKPLPSGEKAKDVEQEKAHAFDVSLTTDESDPTVKAVRDASVFLRTIAIPSFLVDVITGRENCSDGSMLTQSLHKKGINMRYLGIVTANMERILTAGQSTDSSAHLNAFLVVSLQEMVFRAAKRILRSLIRGLLPDEWSAVVSHFLNCLVGVESDPKPVHEPSPFVSDSPSTWTSLTPTSLRAIITTEVQKRFRYNLPETYLTRDLKKPQIVRELALRVGFQLVARDYQFEAVAAEAEGAAKKSGKKARFGSSTFEPQDVVAFVPTVKDAEPSSAASEETMEAGKITVNRGDKLAGLELMQESISLYETIHALFHKDVARAYNAYSVTVIQLYRQALGERSSEEPPKEGEVPEFYEQLQLAIRFQRQCVIVAERTLGLDHPDTLSYYQNLAMLEHLGDDLEMALKMFRHVLELWDVVYGVDHPDQLVLLTNIGQLLSLGSQFESSSSVFRSVCEVGSKIYGPNSVHIAQAQHALGQARFCVGDYAGAAEHSGIAARIFLDRLGKEDPLAIEAEGLHNAFVAQEKAAAKGTAGKRFVPPQRAALSSRAANGSTQSEQQQQPEEVIPTAPAGKKGAEAVKVNANGVASRGHLEVEDLVNFISGDASKTKGSKSKSKKKAAK